MASVHAMSVDEFGDYLLEKFDEDVVEIMKKNKISGATFLKLSERQIESMIPAVGDVVELLDLQTKFGSSTQVSHYHLMLH